MGVEPRAVTFFDRTKREVDGLRQTTDAELLAWAEALKHDTKPRRQQLKAEPVARRTRPLVAAGR